MSDLINTYADIAKTARDCGRAELNTITSRDRAIAAYAAHGVETEGMRSTYLASFLVGYLRMQDGKTPAFDRALAILDKKGFATKARANARRTQKEEEGYTAARQSLKRVRDKSEVTPLDKRGATSNPGKGKDAKTDSGKDSGKDSGNGTATASETRKKSSDKTPVAASSQDAAAFMLAYMNKNPNAFQGKTGNALKRAIVAHHKAICEPEH